MNVVGNTSQNIIYLARKDKPFLLDEYYLIEDELNGFPICKIIKSEESGNLLYNGFDKNDIYNDLVTLDFINYRTVKDNIESDFNKVYIATAIIEKEITYPIRALATIKYPTFEQLKPLLFQTEIDTGLVLGNIRGTDGIHSWLPDKYKNISPMFNGESIVKQTGVPFIFDFVKLKQFPHIGLFGGSGSGKSFALNVIMEEINKKRIPNIILDPHYEVNFNNLRKDVPKSLEYDYSKNSVILYVGKDIGINFTELNVDELCNILQFSGDMSQPMISTLRELHRYSDTFSTLMSRIQKLIQLFDTYERSKDFKKEVTTPDFLFFEKYRGRVTGLSTLVAIQWRLQALLSDGVFLGNIDAVEKALFNRQSIIIRGSIRHLNIISSYILKKFYKKRRYYIDSFDKGLTTEVEKFPPFMVTIDEAHTFIPKSNINSPTKSILKTIAQEGRKYGIFEILSTQRPILLDDTIIAQLSTKMIFRTTIGEDISLIEKETDLSTDDIKRLPYLTSGNCFISSAILGKTISIRFRTTFTTPKTNKHPFDEIEEFGVKNDIEESLLKNLPLTTYKLAEIIPKLSKTIGRMVSFEEVEECLEEMTYNKKIKKEESAMGYFYSK